MSGSNQLIYFKNYVSKNNLKQKKKQARRIAFSLYKKEISYNEATYKVNFDLTLAALFL